jgi:hypothetical protein
MSYKVIGDRLDASVHYDGVPDGTYLKLSATTIVPVEWDYGYQVAYTEFRAPRSGYTTTDRTLIWELINDHYVDEFVGVWTDNDGLTWVEKCYWLEYEFPARELGTYWRQHSIWDWSASEEIEL